MLHAVRHHSRSRRSHTLALIGYLLLGLSMGCQDATSPSPSGGIPSKHGHVHVPPHGGTAVVLGDEDYHLEFVHVPRSATLRCYVLDGHMENFVRIKAPAVALKLTVDGASHDLELAAIAQSATGETVGDTSQFSATADWLRNAGNTSGRIAAIEIRGQTFTDIDFDLAGDTTAN